MKRSSLVAFNVVLGVALASLYALVCERRGWSGDVLERTLRENALAGILMGGAIGLGAALGPRPALGWKKCLPIQLGVVATTALGALVAWLLPREVSAVDAAMRDEMTRHGLRVGSGIGAAVGTVIQMVQVYIRRRRASRPR